MDTGQTSASLGDSRLRTWPVTVQTVIGVGVFAWALTSIADITVPCVLTLALSVFLIIGFGRFTIRIPWTSHCLTVSEPLMLSLLLLGGLEPAIILAGLDGYISSARHTQRWQLRLANGSLMVLCALAAGICLRLLAPSGAQFSELAVERMVLPVLAAALTCFVVNTVIIAVVQAIRSGKSALSVWRELCSWTWLSYAVSAGAALAIWSAHKHFGTPALLLGIPTMTTIYVFFWGALQRAASRQSHFDQLEALHARMMEAFALAIDSRDPRARGHARRVQAYAEALGRLVAQDREGSAGGEEYDKPWIDSLAAAAVLHDIGKLGVPDHLLHKADGLSPGERERLRLHASLGAAIVGRIPFPRPIAPAIRHHHERWDGAGYPDALRGEEIPLEARIIALADQLDHVHHAYGSSGATLSTLLSFVARYSGTRFDPGLCELYCQNAEAVEQEVLEQAASFFETDEQCPTEDDTAALLGITRAQQEAGRLYDLARRLGKSLDIEDTCTTIAGELLGLVPATTCAIYMADPSGSILVPRHVEGRLSDLLAGHSFAAGEGITGWCFETGESAIDVDPRVDLGFLTDGFAPKPRSEAAVPIIDDQGRLGVIAFYAEDDDAFEADDLRVLDAVIPQIAHALRNATLFESTQATSMTDALTGLPNSRSLYATLEKEMARATRRGMPLSVVVLDLDGFKPINDNYGHQAGDQVLQGVAKLLASTFRQGDIVCRYAGDEFVTLLPETSPEEGRTIVKRVQERLASEQIAVFAGGKRILISVGCSAGLSCFPIDGSSLEELIHRADKEMYRDKSRRRARASAEQNP